MSFQLYFYKPSDQIPLSIQDIQLALLNFEQIRLIDNGSTLDFEYENSITGVYFWLSFAAHGYANEEIVQFEGFRYTGLSFNINYYRPSYFMYEANPLLQHLIRTLNLYVYDPQADAACIIPYQPYSDELIRSWQAGNRRTGSKSPNRVSLTREKARYAWEYLYKYPYFKNSLAADHFVPKLFFIRLKDGTVRTAVVFPYPDVEHQLIPDVDYLYVKTKRKHWLLNRSVEGLISFEQLRNVAPSAFQSFSEPVSYYLLQNQELLTSVMQDCEVIRRDKFSILANDGFVDLDPPSQAGTLRI